MMDEPDNYKDCIGETLPSHLPTIGPIFGNPINTESKYMTRVSTPKETKKYFQKRFSLLGVTK